VAFVVAAANMVTQSWVWVRRGRDRLGMDVRFSAMISTFSVGLALGACAMPDTDSFRVPDASALFAARSVSNYREKTLPPVAPADLVDAGGNCAGAYAPPAASGDQSVQANVPLREAGIPPVPAAIALEMTECDVVKRAGVAERAEIGTNDRRERTATLTYTSGERPGIYNFVDGRLKSMELGPDQPAASKTAKKPAKPAKRAAQPNRVTVQ
jgi:hypothetical protein